MKNSKHLLREAVIPGTNQISILDKIWKAIRGRGYRDSDLLRDVASSVVIRGAS